MIRKSLAAVSVLGSAALAAAALTTTVSAASPTTAAPAAAPKVAAAAYPASSTTITKVKRHGEWTTSFKMVRSTASINANCLVNAKAKVAVTSKGSVEVMKVVATGLPKKTEFDFFVLQVPDLPFGLSWYQGDLETDKHGKATGSSSAGSRRRPSPLLPTPRRLRSCTVATPTPTRPPVRCTSTTSGSGSTTRPTLPLPAAATASRRSTGSTTRGPRP